MSIWGKSKFRKSAGHQILSSLGHVSIGLLVAAPLYNSAWWQCLTVALTTGVVREVAQWSLVGADLDSLNLLDRLRDTVECGAGGALAWSLWLAEGALHG